MQLTRLVLAAALVSAPLVAATGAAAPDKSIVVASTTSTQDSGLFGHILPLFKAKTGIDVKVVAQGTGQALDTGKRGDADVVFVHATAQEEKFVADGYGVQRFDVMYNDFVLIGPKADPARIKAGTVASHDIRSALKAIHLANAPFVSRGDKSGTHAAELALWKAATLDPAATKQVIARGLPVHRLGDGSVRITETDFDAWSKHEERWLFTVQDLAVRLNVSERVLWRMRSSGKLPEPIELGPKLIRWGRTEILDWIAVGCPNQKIWGVIKAKRPRLR